MLCFCNLIMCMQRLKNRSWRFIFSVCVCV